MAPEVSTHGLRLEDIAWVRSLARRMVADEHLAEDVAQDTLAAAWASARRGEPPGRPWLVAVARNFFRQVARTSRHRAEREVDAARAEALPPVDAALAELEAHQRLMRAVAELDEPLRTVLVLRFVDGRTPREIGRVLDEPASVVSHRITTALRNLRARLDRDGGREGWLGAVAPLCLRVASDVGVGAGAGLGASVRQGSATGLGVVLVQSKLLIAASVVAAGAAAWMFWGRDAQPAASGPDSVDGARPSLARSSAGAGAASADSTDVERASVAATQRASSNPAPAPDASLSLHRVSGRVLFADGGELAGVAVGVRGEDAQAISAGGGWFELETSRRSGSIEALDARWITISAGEFVRDSSATPIVLVSESARIGGEVIDEAGRPLEGARVWIDRPLGFETRFGVDLEGAQELPFRRDSDARGRFVFERAPAIEGGVLRVALDGFALHAEPAPRADALDLRVVLKRPEIRAEGSVAGVVLGPDRKPAPRARVALGLASVLCDDEGRFAIDLARAVTSDELRAVKEGFLPAILERPFEPQGGDGGWPAHVEVVLPAPALALRGVLLDHERKPVAGARISIADPTSFGVIGRMPATLEGLAAGARVPPEALDSERALPDEDGDDFWDYTSRPAPPTALWNWVRSDSQGRFELPGLLDRRYRLRVQPADSLWIHVSDPVDPRDAHVQVVMPAPKSWPEVAGRIVDADGQPVPGASLRLQVEAFGVRTRVFGGTVDVSMREPGAEARTDAQGRFRFEDVPQGALIFGLRGDGLIPSEHELDALPDPLDVELEAELRCNFELELAEPFDRADEVAALDGEGRPLDLLRIRGGSVNAYTDVALVDGRTGVTAVSSRARTLVLRKEGSEVARLPVRLNGERTTTVRW